jgi:DNA-binding transcriptional LysR family regulator
VRAVSRKIPLYLFDLESDSDLGSRNPTSSDCGGGWMIDKLEFFIALANQKHFGRAAEECGVTQPTLSAAIQQLEDQLGVMLVLRGSRFQGLTPEGQRVLEWARRIVGDARTMREEMRAARKGLAGHIRIAAIPTALAMIPKITAPFQERHPDVTFSVISRNSLQVLSLLENLEIDAGVTYLENEPLGRVTSVPFYAERYHLITAAGSPLAERESVTWREVGALRLCLLTADMQNRRIINRHLLEAGATVQPTLESNSMIVLFSHVLTGRWASIMPKNVADAFGFPADIRKIPITEPAAEHLVGLVATHREPFTPLVSALLHEARLLAAAAESR